MFVLISIDRAQPFVNWFSYLFDQFLCYRSVERLERLERVKERGLPRLGRRSDIFSRKRRPSSLSVFSFSGLPLCIISDIPILGFQTFISTAGTAGTTSNWNRTQFYPHWAGGSNYHRKQPSTLSHLMWSLDLLLWQGRFSQVREGFN